MKSKPLMTKPLVVRIQRIEHRLRAMCVWPMTMVRNVGLSWSLFLIRDLDLSVWQGLH